MVRCPDCNAECRQDYEDARIVRCVAGYIIIQYTRVIQCEIHGLFKQANQTKEVPLP